MKSKLSKNKKGIGIFVPFVTLLTLIALTSIFIFVSFKQDLKDANNFDQVIGEKQSALFDSVLRAEKASLYLEKATQLAIPKAEIELGEEGGLPLIGFEGDNPCRREEYLIWNEGKELCFEKPDFASFLGKNLKDILSNQKIFSPPTISSVDISGGKTKISFSPLKTPILVSEEPVSFTPTTLEQFDPSSFVYVGGCPDRPVQKNGWKENKYLEVYGKTKEQVEHNLVKINFFGRDVMVHRLAAPAFICVEKQIQKSCQGKGADYDFWREKGGGTFNWRYMRGSKSRLSLHSFGIAMDINPDSNPFCVKGRPDLSYKSCRGNFLVTDIPPCVRNAFKFYGFEWGGDWKTRKDAMHFEWKGYDGWKEWEAKNQDKANTPSPDAPTEKVPEPKGTKVKEIPTSYSSTTKITSLAYSQEKAQAMFEETKANLNRYKVDGTPLIEFIKKRATEEGVPADIFLGLITQESSGKADAGSTAGAYGLTQIYVYDKNGRLQKGKENYAKGAKFDIFPTNTDINSRLKNQINGGLKILKEGYSESAKPYKCNSFCTKKEGGKCQLTPDSTHNINIKKSAEYSGWERALRFYNGWGCTNYPDFDYVEKVMQLSTYWANNLNIEPSATYNIQNTRVADLGSYTTYPAFSFNSGTDLSIYDSLKEFAGNVLKNCPDGKDECITNAEKDFNKKEKGKWELKPAEQCIPRERILLKRIYESYRIAKEKEVPENAKGPVCRQVFNTKDLNKLYKNYDFDFSRLFIKPEQNQLSLYKLKKDFSVIESEPVLLDKIKLDLIPNEDETAFEEFLSFKKNTLLDILQNPVSKTTGKKTITSAGKDYEVTKDSLYYKPLCFTKMGDGSVVARLGGCEKIPECKITLKRAHELTSLPTTETTANNNAIKAFCAESERKVLYYDEAENVLTASPIKIIFALDFSKQEQNQPSNQQTPQQPATEAPPKTSGENPQSAQVSS